MRILFVSLALAVAAAGCKKDRDTPPPAPTGGGSFENGGTQTGNRRDGGPKKPIVDAGFFDGGFDGGESIGGALRAECIDADPAEFLNGDTSPAGLLNGVRTPSDFNVTRVVATWRKGCVAPTILIEMAEGECTDKIPEEHRLQIQLPAQGIESGEIHAGLNTLDPETNALDAATIDQGARFLYIRPKRLTPNGAWGTCVGAPGTLEITNDEPGVTKDTRLQGRFSLTLSACDGSDNAVEEVEGSFNVVLERGLDDVCPDGATK